VRGRLIRVVLVARAPLARAGLRALLETDPRFWVAGEAADLATMVSRSWEDADVALLDGRGLDIRDLWPDDTEPIPGVVLLGGDPALTRAFRARGSPFGYLSEAVSVDQIQAAIAAVDAGLSVLEPRAEESLSIQAIAIEGMEPPALTPREGEVLNLVAAGLTNKGIAMRLGISEHTVKFHLASVLTKLDSGSRAEAVARAAHLGIISL
jgi:DNA-binding NarL/FixJ family response regulator